MARGRGDKPVSLRVPDPIQDPMGFRLSWEQLDESRRKAYVWPKQLDYADLSFLDLSGCDLSNCSLYGADLTQATLRDANLQHADLRGCVTKGADWSDANLDNALTDPDFVPTFMQRTEADGYWDSEENTYTTGDGTVVRKIHPFTDDCVQYNCVIHNPSNHSLRHMPTHWRWDTKFMERTCEHGVGHPDPDHVAYLRRTQGGSGYDVHGCDGCCS